MRLFIAVAADEEVKAAAAAVVARLRRVGRDPTACGGGTSSPYGSVAGGYRWVDPRDMHATLRFLGEMPEASLPEIEALMRRATAQTKPFEIVYGGVGAFDSLEDPRVVWLALDEGAAPAFAREAGSVRGGVGNDVAAAPMERLANLLGRDEPRSYSPHLTLGRRRGTASPLEFLAALKAEPVLGLRRPVTKISLYADRPAPFGHAHEILLEANLSG